MKDKKHVKMLKAFMEWYKKRLHLPENGYKVEFETEVPYNYYGERGFVDLVVKRTIPKYDFETGIDNPKRIGEQTIHDICELKTCILDLGETLRQIKRAKEFFPKTRTGKFLAKLIILDTPENHQCCIENKDVFIAAKIDIDIFNDVKLERYMGIWHYEDGLMNVSSYFILSLNGDAK